MDARSSPAARSTTTRTRPVCAALPARCWPSTATTCPVAWKHRSERYGEKLATPDTSVGDLIGDIDPIKVAEGRTLGDPETVHYGLVPRTNRGIFAINELPDLAERIQVALLNVLEERDIQVRGYQLRLPLDLLLVASANPEDYTNRGRIITPLKDRFGAEVRTHYPLELADELDADRAGGGGAVVRRPTLARADRARAPARGRRPVRPRGARRAAGRPALRRLGPVRDRRGRDGGGLGRAPGGASTGEAGRGGPGRATCRPSCPASRGKVEFDDADEGREVEVLDAPAAPRRSPRRSGPGWPGSTSPAAGQFEGGLTVETGDAGAGRPSCSPSSAPSRCWPSCSTGSSRTASRGPAAVGIAAAAVEFALEGLYLNRRLAKDDRPAAARSTAAERWRPVAYRYGAWHGGPDPLAPPYDVREALDEIGDDVLAGMSPREALNRDLLRRGARAGAAWTTCAARRAARAASCATRGRPRRHPGAGPRAARPGAGGRSARALFPDPADAARLAEAELDALPRDTARAVRELADYQWRSPEARADLRADPGPAAREVLDAQFAGMREALQNADPEDMQRIRDMMADLNDMLDADARGEHTQRAVRRVHGKHGEFFPEQPGRTSTSWSTRWPAGRPPPSG